MRRLVVSLLTALTLLLAGCGASEIDQRPPDPSPIAIPEGAATLAQLGLTNGPANFHLPADLKIDDAIDQPNVVTLVLSPGEGVRVVRHLAAHAQSLDFYVIAQSDDAIVIDGEFWRGEATTSATQAGLTLRRQPQ